ncbi:MAG: nitroreductase family protein [Candidatus Dadabacteria bacterium]|nr:nitroreductase family protein [Candidatus Dadabacteria bacterium]
MEVFECVKTLSSIRSFVTGDVPEEVIGEVMESGRLAPSARNQQPWEFILVTDRGVLKGLEKYCTSGKFVSEAAFAVVVLTDPSSKWHEVDSTRAVQNMVLTAWGRGLGSCWIGMIDKKGLAQYLGIPGSLNILTVLPFGYFDDGLSGHGKSRKPPHEVFHLNRFGVKPGD